MKQRKNLKNKKYIQPPMKFDIALNKYVPDLPIKIARSKYGDLDKKLNLLFIILILSMIFFFIIFYFLTKK